MRGIRRRPNELQIHLRLGQHRSGALAISRHALVLVAHGAYGHERARVGYQTDGQAPGMARHSIAGGRGARSRRAPRAGLRLADSSSGTLALTGRQDVDGARLI